MQSKITIEVDFQDGNKPVIQVLLRRSDDVRDKLIDYFMELLGHESSWCKIYCEHTSYPDDPSGQFQRWKISPISPDRFQEEANIMFRAMGAGAD